MHQLTLSPLLPPLLVSDGGGDAGLPIGVVLVAVLAVLGVGALSRAWKDHQRSQRRKPPHRHRITAPIPSQWDRPGARNGSWVETDRIVTIPVGHFRRSLGVEADANFKRELMRIHWQEFT